jgi:hypothetical protein
VRCAFFQLSRIVLDNAAGIESLRKIFPEYWRNGHGFSRSCPELRVHSSSLVVSDPQPGGMRDSLAADDQNKSIRRNSCSEMEGQAFPDRNNDIA